MPFKTSVSQQFFTQVVVIFIYALVIIREKQQQNPKLNIGFFLTAT